MGRKALIISFFFLVFFITNHSLARECECSTSNEKLCSGNYLYVCNGCNYLSTYCECGCNSSTLSCRSSYCSSSCPCGCSSNTCNGGVCKSCPPPAPTYTPKPIASPTRAPTPGGPCGGIAPNCSGSCNIGYLCATPAPAGPCTCVASNCLGCSGKPTPNCPATPANGSGSYPICNYTTCSWGCTGGDCCTTWSNWYCFQDAQGLWWERRECQTPASCTDTQIRQGCSTLDPSGSSSTGTPVPSPTATPIPGAWAKLKNTSFYSNKDIYNPIPDPPIPYDENDDASPYFIIAPPASDPGVVSAGSILLDFLPLPVL